MTKVIHFHFNTRTNVGDAAHVIAIRECLGAVLDRPQFTYLAPSAAGNTWYPYSFMSAFDRNEPYLSSALRRIDALVNEVAERGVPKARVVLLGFSQGACLAGEFACRHAGRYGAVVMWSGGLIGPPGTTWTNPGSFEGTPVFLGCSDRDPHIPKGRVDESARRASVSEP